MGEEEEEEFIHNLNSQLKLMKSRPRSLWNMLYLKVIYSNVYVLCHVLYMYIYSVLCHVLYMYIYSMYYVMYCICIMSCTVYVYIQYIIYCICIYSWRLLVELAPAGVSTATAGTCSLLLPVA